MGDERAVVPAQAERVLQLRAAGEHRPRGTARAAGIGSGTYPRDRRSIVSRPRNARTTESSVRMWIGRSWVRNASAMPRQPGQRVLVVGRRSARRRRCRWSAPSGGRARGAAGGAAACTAASPRADGCPAPPPRATGRRGRPARSSTIGRRGLVSSDAAVVVHLAQPRAPPARSAAISANGLSSRCLRARSGRRGRLAGRVDRQVIAAQALDRQHPARGQQGRRPRPTRIPGRRHAAPTASSRRSLGPQAGQHTGWAWNRRSAGSGYSAAHAAHSAKPAIVVSGRS